MFDLKTSVINNTTIEEWADSLLEQHPILLYKLSKLSLINQKDSRALFVEVVKFMYLVSKADVKLSPSLLVDLGWHEFILFTKVYQEFCHQKLGRFIHHVPDDDQPSNNRAYLKTIQHYIVVFGKPPTLFWGKVAQEEWEDTQCGSCQSN